MEKYDYTIAVINSLMNALKDDDTYARHDNEIFDDWCERVYELAIEDDSVTGAKTGSWTCNTAEAERYVLSNFKLCIQAFDDLGYKMPRIDEFIERIEEMDAIIRHYVVSQVYRDVCKAYAASKENS